MLRQTRRACGECHSRDFHHLWSILELQLGCRSLDDLTSGNDADVINDDEDTSSGVQKRSTTSFQQSTPPAGPVGQRCPMLEADRLIIRITGHSLLGRINGCAVSLSCHSIVQVGATPGNSCVG